MSSFLAQHFLQGSPKFEILQQEFVQTSCPGGTPKKILEHGFGTPLGVVEIILGVCDPSTGLNIQGGAPRFVIFCFICPYLASEASPPIYFPISGMEFDNFWLSLMFWHTPWGCWNYSGGMWPLNWAQHTGEGTQICYILLYMSLPSLSSQLTPYTFYRLIIYVYFWWFWHTPWGCWNYSGGMWPLNWAQHTGGGTQVCYILLYMSLPSLRSKPAHILSHLWHGVWQFLIIFDVLAHPLGLLKLFWGYVTPQLGSTYRGGHPDLFHFALYVLT